MDMKERLQELAEAARKRIEESDRPERLNEVKVAYLGKKGGKPGNEFEPHLSGKQCFKGILQRKIVCRGGAGTTGSDC